MRIVFSLLLTVGFLPSAAMTQEVVDTIKSSHGDIVMFSDRTWEYLEDLNFDGVMNHHLNELIMDDSSLNFIQTWDHDVCYTSDMSNDLSKLRDTLWMCLAQDLENEFRIPVNGRVTSRYGIRHGRYHNGIDLDLETGDTVCAAWPGKIRYAKYNEGGFGNLVIIRHENGLETFYAHLDKHLVVPNQEVKAGEPIGLGGNTGRSYGSHLHFEVRFYDAPMNPEEVIDFDKRQCKDENLFVHKGLFRPGAKPSDAENYVPSNVASASAVGAKYYKIRSGDTLSAIAARNRTSVSKLCQLNGIRPTTVLQVGRSIRIR